MPYPILDTHGSDAANDASFKIRIGDRERPHPPGAGFGILLWLIILAALICVTMRALTSNPNWGTDAHTNVSVRSWPS